MKNLQKNFSHAFEGKVWNIDSEIGGDYLVIEARNEHTFETAFFIYEPSDAAIIKGPITLEETWWVGVTHVSGQIIVFHKFEDTESPEHKSYQAVDVDSGTIIWEASDVSFSEYGRNYLKGMKNNSPFIIDLQKGNPIHENDLIDAPQNNHLLYPFLYVPKSGYHNTVHSFLSAIGMDSDNRYGIHYLDTMGFIIISFYYHNTGLENRLIVLNQSRELLLDEVLGTELKGIADRPFFVYHDHLIFVKENSNFLSYQLSQV
ncbi:MAG: DUF4905 domain-containing protein [Bacteroidota bacterium]